MVPMCISYDHPTTKLYRVVSTVTEGLYLVATVGDDNALTILKLLLSASSLHTACLEVLCREASAHASSITSKSNMCYNVKFFRIFFMQVCHF